MDPINLLYPIYVSIYTSTSRIRHGLCLSVRSHHEIPSSWNMIIPQKEPQKNPSLHYCAQKFLRNFHHWGSHMFRAEALQLQLHAWMDIHGNPMGILEIHDACFAGIF